MGNARRLAGLAFCVALAAPFGGGQVTVDTRKKPPAASEERPRTNLRVDANLVLVPVTVCDPLNRPVTGLEKENFRVLENNVEQPITHFAMDDEPVAVGLAFDVSGSMGAKLGMSRMAARAFFRLANPEDEFFLVLFDDSPRLVVPLTQDVGQIENQITFTQSKGSTALVDAVVLGLHELKKSKLTRKALLIISDGGENNSRYTDHELRDLVRESDALLYAIGVFGGGSTREENAGPRYMAGMVEESGGRMLPAAANDLPDITAKIGIELRNRYILGYSPANQQRDGRYRPVQVKVVPPRGLPPLKAFWRRGYYAPSD
jgi:VWFA-related protein